MITVRYIGPDEAILAGAYIQHGESRRVTPAALAAAQQYHPDGFIILVAASAEDAGREGITAFVQALAQPTPAAEQAPIDPDLLPTRSAELEPPSEPPPSPPAHPAPTPQPRQPKQPAHRRDRRSR